MKFPIFVEPPLFESEPYMPAEVNQMTATTNNAWRLPFQ